MSLVLILTTGGSDKPLVKSIIQSKPGYIIFICSQDREGPPNEVGSFRMVDGEGYPCKDKDGERVSIVRQLDIGAEYYEKVYISDPDNIGLCYQAALEAIEKARKINQGGRIRADYTGGTKTMSSGLAMAAIDQDDIEIYVVSGLRRDLVRVSSGTEMLRQAEWTPILWTRKRRVLADLFKTRDYKACIETINDVAGNLPGNSKLHKVLNASLSICQGFHAWEEFRHREALNFLEPFGKILSAELAFLRFIIKSYESYEKQVMAARGEGQGCTMGVKPNLGLVYDILRNAERRLQKHEYDDAVGRTYRALELIAQICLLYNYPPINTSDVRIENLPEAIQQKYHDIKLNQVSKENSYLQLGLFRSYELLHDLNNPAGIIGWERRKEMLALLEIRNNSIFAHGLKPVEMSKAWEFYNFVCELVNEIEGKLKISNQYAKQPQFPDILPVLDLN
jgi:CRISPR-associated protein (TIGR02710 family)